MTLSAWADLSIILLAIEAFVICLVLGVIYFYATRGILQLMRRLRITFPIIQGYFRQAEQVTKTASDRVAAAARQRISPFLETSSWGVPSWGRTSSGSFITARFPRRRTSRLRPTGSWT